MHVVAAEKIDFACAHANTEVLGSVTKRADARGFDTARDSTGANKGLAEVVRLKDGGNIVEVAQFGGNDDDSALGDARVRDLLLLHFASRLSQGRGVGNEAC